MTHSTTQRKTTAGFSLVEVTIALGICASGLLITVALLPSVLSQIGDAADRNAHTRIKQSLSTRYAMMEWGLIEEQFRDEKAERFYFDSAGSEVEKDTFEAVYAAEIRIGSRRTLSGDDTHNRFIRYLEIRVSQELQREDALTNPECYQKLYASLGNETKLRLEYRD